MEFEEFRNPEREDYDIISSLGDGGFNSPNSTNSSSNPCVEELTALIGVLEDVTEEELQDQYGISMSEYLSPTADTIRKVEQKLNEHTPGMHR